MLARDVLKGNPDHLRHAICDAAGVVSHQSTGQPFEVAARMKAIPPEVAARITEELAPIAALHLQGAKS